MSGEVKFVKPTNESVEFIAKNMRQADVEEVWASNRHTPYKALIRGWRLSHRSVVITIDDEPCVMIGFVIHDILAGIGVPWLLGTEGALKYKRCFLTRVPAIIDEMLSICPTLINYVHADNKVSIKWLERIGFTLNDPLPYGAANEMFHKFYLRKVC